MSILLILLLIGLLFGLSGLFTAAKWLIIICVVFWLLGVFAYKLNAPK